MKHGLLLIVTYLVAVLQASGHFRLHNDGGPVAFLPLVFVLAVFLFNDWRAVVWAAVMGLVSDCLKPGAVGIDMLCAVLVAGVALRLRRGKRSNPPLIVRMLFGGGMVFAFHLLSQALSVTAARETANAGVLLSQVATQTSGALVAGLVFVLGFNAVVPLVYRGRRSGFPA
jgi:rod shape-determining protein MreD